MKIIAVDFDGTLCEAKWPEIGEPRQFVINQLIKQQADGAKLILWTCREGELLRAAVMWCLNHGLQFDAINDNLEENKTLYGNNSRKVYATEYWDDKSVVIVGAGEVTSITHSNPNGGSTIERWYTTDHWIVSNPMRYPGVVAVAHMRRRSLWRRMKEWWKKCRCE